MPNAFRRVLKWGARKGTKSSKMFGKEHAARKRGIWSMTELAKQIPCSVPSLYFAIERPSRYSRVYARIRELTGL